MKRETIIRALMAKDDKCRGQKGIMTPDKWELVAIEVERRQKASGKAWDQVVCEEYNERHG